MSRWITYVVTLAAAVSSARAQADFGRPTLLRDIGIEQKMGARLPLDVPFTDDHNRTVTLREYAGKPMVLALVYYSCPSLCDLVLNGAIRSLHGLKFRPGEDFQMVAISFDPRENYMLARDKKANYVKEYGRPGTEDGFHFLTGTEGASRMVADAVGFRFRYDPNSNQYAHPSALMIVTPDGAVSRYFYGINYPPLDVKLGLMDGANSRIGSPVDQVQLFCFHYDPASGKYGVVIMNVIRLGGVLTLLLVGGGVLLMLFRERRTRLAHG